MRLPTGFLACLLCIFLPRCCICVELAFKTDREWLKWKEDYSRSYESVVHELERYVTWKSNRAFIGAHNELKDEFGYTLAMNQYGDMSSSEYYYSTRCLLNYNYSPKPDNVTVDGHTVKRPTVKTFQWPKGLNTTSLPSEVDWRTMGAVAAVKDQGRCRSCYAFSVTGAIEGMQALASGKLVALSEQNLVDCSVIYGNQGCSGGSRETAILYIVDNNGIDTSKSYPYISYQYLCRFKSSNIGGKATGMVKIRKGSESDLMAAVAIAGPVTVGIDHKHSSFQFYSSGIFYEPSCSYTKLTHAMLVVGYGTYKGIDYWLVKNSWGKNWGYNGYIMMSRGKYNQCGIATKALYPTI